MNLIDRFLVDDLWVGHTNAWTIPGTEDLKPYITAQNRKVKWLFGTAGMPDSTAAMTAMPAVQNRKVKWLFGTAGMAVMGSVLSGIMLLFVP